MSSLPPLRPLNPQHPYYHDIESKFRRGWVHAEKSAKVKAIYALDRDELEQSYHGRRFRKYVKQYGGRCEMLFHGTRRKCRIGNDSGDLEPCHDRGCYLCCILRDSFSVGKACSEGMFGPGIYTTDISSKADIYAMNHHLRSSKHAMLVCGVSNNNPQYLKTPEYTRYTPDAGHDCVEGVTFANGGSVRYPETVVYSEAAIVPVALIIYTRQGWEGY